MRILVIVFGFVFIGCAPDKAVRVEHQLTVKQSDRKMELLSERDLLLNPDSLLGRTETQESELLSLANVSGVKGNEKWFGLIVPRYDRASDFTGPYDEGDGVLSIHAVDGWITDAKYVTAEF